MRSIFICLTLSLLFFSCKDAEKETPETTSEIVEAVEETMEESIQSMENPSEAGSQLPRLFSNGSEL